MNHPQPRVHVHNRHTHATMYTSHTRKTTDIFPQQGWSTAALSAVLTTFQQHREARRPRVVATAGKKKVDGGLLELFMPTHAGERPLPSLVVGMQGRSWSCTAHGFLHLHITKGARVVFCDRERAWLLCFETARSRSALFGHAAKIGEHRTAVSAAPLELERAYHCHIAAFSISV